MVSKKILFIFAYIILNLLIIYIVAVNNLFLKINGDTSGWINLAKKINLNQNFTQDIWWPPLYPILISLLLSFNNYLILISIFQIIIFIFSLFVMSKILQVRNKWIYICIFALLPSHLIITKLALADTIFFLFFVLHIYLFLKFLKNQKISLIYFSILFLILATFTKPVSIFLHFFEFFFLIMIYKNEFKTFFLIILLIPTLIYFLYSYKNFYYTQVFTFANVSNYNLLAHNFFHIYYYIPENIKSLPTHLGYEFKQEEAESLRQYLKNEYLNNYIKNKNLTIDSYNLKMKAAGSLGLSKILENLYIYLPIHFIKSLFLFIPNFIETLKDIFGLQHKIFFIFSSLISGFIIFATFVLSFLKFIRQKKSNKIYRKLKFFILILIFYNLLIIGPTAIDDGGRSSLVFIFLIFTFMGI